KAREYGTWSSPCPAFCFLFRLRFRAGSEPAPRSERLPRRRIESAIPTVDDPVELATAGFDPATFILIIGAEARRQAAVNNHIQFRRTGRQTSVLWLGQQHVRINLVGE